MSEINLKLGLLSKRIIKISYIYAIILSTFVWFLNTQNSKGFAIISMGIGLFFLWGIISGYIMFKLKDPLKAFFETQNYPDILVVSLVGVFLALVEEGIATFMTNLAPLFGFSPYDVFITASPNYIEVVTRHSVIVFIPWFIAWGFILNRYTIHPNTVFVLFGITGLIAESITFGLQNFLQFGFWIIIYGLMMYIPSYIVFNPSDLNKKSQIRWFFYPVFVIVSYLALLIWGLLFVILLIILGLKV